MLTRRQIWMGGALLIALFMLVMDRWLGPAQSPISALASPASNPDAKALIAGQIKGLALLPAATPENEARAEIPDVFNSTRIAIRVAPPPEVASNPSLEISSTGSFAQRYALQGVVLSKRPAVLIGRQLLRVGERLGGFTLESVSAEGAVFVSPDDKRVTLPAPKRERTAGSS